jgi:hypothetical protein
LLRAHANLESLPFTKECMICEQRQRLRALGEIPVWIQNPDRKQEIAVILKRNGRILILDMQFKDWLSPLDGTTLTEALDEDPFSREPGLRELINEDVAMPPFFGEFSGDESGSYKWPV